MEKNVLRMILKELSIILQSSYILINRFDIQCNIFLLHLAGWQSGYAAACKPFTPVRFRLQPPKLCIRKYNVEWYLLTCPSGGIGRHKGLKIPR